MSAASAEDILYGHLTTSADTAKSFLTGRTSKQIRQQLKLEERGYFENKEIGFVGSEDWAVRSDQLPEWFKGYPKISISKGLEAEKLCTRALTKGWDQYDTHTAMIAKKKTIDQEYVNLDIDWQRNGESVPADPYDSGQSMISALQVEVVEQMSPGEGDWYFIHEGWFAFRAVCLYLDSEQQLLGLVQA